MRVREERQTPDGKPRWDISVSLTKDVAVKFLMLKAALINEGQYDNDSWIISQLIVGAYNRNKAERIFKQLLESGDKNAMATLAEMDRLKCRPPVYSYVKLEKEGDPPKASV